jgi:hypothetical protein
MSRNSQSGFSNIKSSLSALKAKTLPKAGEYKRYEGLSSFTIR